MKKLLCLMMVLSAVACANADLIAYYGDGTSVAQALNDQAGYSGLTASTAVWTDWGNDPIMRNEFGANVPYPVGPTAVAGGDRWYFARTSRTTGSGGSPAAPSVSTDYFGFTVTADPGKVLNLNTLTFGVTSACITTAVAGASWRTDYIVFVNVDGAGFTAMGLDTVGAAGTMVSGSVAGTTTLNTVGPVAMEVVNLSSIVWANTVEIRVALANNLYSDQVASLVQGFQLVGAAVGDPRAHIPNPADGQNHVGVPNAHELVDVLLQWKAGADPNGGMYAVDSAIKTQYLYLSDNQTATPNDPNLYYVGEIAVTDLNEPDYFYEFLGVNGLEFEGLYLWRVDQGLDDGQGGVYPPGDPNNLEGHVWSFKTARSDGLKVDLIAYYNDGKTIAQALNDQAGYSGVTASTAVWTDWGNDPIARNNFGTSVPYPVGPTAAAGGNYWLFARSSRTTGSAGTASNPAFPLLTTDYFGFTVTANDGYVLNLNSLTFGVTSACITSAITAPWQTDYIVFVNVDGAGFTAVGLDTVGAVGQLVSGSVAGTNTLNTVGPVAKEVVDLSSIIAASSVEVRVALASNVYSDLIASLVQGFQLEAEVLFDDRAHSPNPDHRQTGVGAPNSIALLDVELQWQAGRDPDGVYAVNPAIKTQYLYMSGNQYVVADPTLYYVGEVAVTDLNNPDYVYEFMGANGLKFDGLYFWRVDQGLDDGQGGVYPPGHPNNLEGPVWSFETEQIELKTDYATWLMIWIANSESWWIDENYRGITTPRDGTWKSPNWANAGWRQDVYADLIDAGIRVVVFDTTNDGFYGRSLTYHNEIHYKGRLKVTHAVGVQDLGITDGTVNPTRLDWVWDNHATDPILKDSYYHIDGKPVLVCYVDLNHWNQLKVLTDPKLTRFKLLWASGENSAADKAGWQLEPQDNVTPSSDVMFVTNALKHAAGHTFDWRKSQAALDYGFRQVQLHDPRLVVVGSYEDMRERNAWFPMDMTNADSMGMMFFDTQSGLLADPYYLRNRVEQWIKNGQPAEVAGGVLRDGLYRLRNVATGTDMKVTTSYQPDTPVVGGASSSKTYNKFGLYHSGNSEYRIENVFSGLTIRMDSAADSATLFQGMHESSNQSLFKLISTGQSRTYYIQSRHPSP